MRGWTYGAEFELSDWPRREPLPPGMGIDVRDVTMVNSDGVAVDPRGELYHLGGEILAAPTEEPGGVADQLATIMKMWPETIVNYRSNLHIHIRVPGLKEDLGALKRVQAHIHQWMPVLLPVIEPIPAPDYAIYQGEEGAWKGARRRHARRRMSHQRMVWKTGLTQQAAATTVEEFFAGEVRDPKTGKLNWAIHPRACVNLRQLRETDTVEFRHFPGTTNPDEVLSAVAWCRNYMVQALEDADPRPLLKKIDVKVWPHFLPYVHWQEVGYQRTCRKFHPPAQVSLNIAAWLVERHS